MQALMWQRIHAEVERKRKADKRKRLRQRRQLQRQCEQRALEERQASRAPATRQRVRVLPSGAVHRVWHD